MQLFYFKNAAAPSLELDKEDARHMTRVLRKKVGDAIHVTDGRGKLFDGTISQVTSNRVVVDLAFAKAEKPPSPSLHIAIAPTKMNDRMEWFLEKCTEIGIQEITPILCDHSERKKIRLNRFEKILVSAMQQSNQLWLPVINELTPLDRFLEAKSNYDLLIAHCEPTTKSLITTELKPVRDTTILIGPEGDFSPREIELSIRAGARPVALGETRLRTETAGIYATTVFNLMQLANR